MWGTDGSRIPTVKHGWVWLFTAVKHWNGECMGWHVRERGDRYAALEPIGQGPRHVFGSLEADAARGLALRMDHGTQYLSDHFANQASITATSSTSAARAIASGRRNRRGSSVHLPAGGR